MSYPTSTIVLVIICVLLTALRLIRAIIKRRFVFDSYLGYTWLFFLSIVAAELISFLAGVWILALISFWAIREYFSLIDIRLQDRLAILGAYLTIPFMYYFIQVDWYGMFIVWIPVYAFLLIPLLVALGGSETEGTVLSIGAIDFGLFLFVFCIGHIAYLLLYSMWMAALLIITVLFCDASICLARQKIKTGWKRLMISYFLPLPLTIAVALMVSPWTEIPLKHSIILASMIPLLVIMGHHAGDFIKKDLGVEEDLLLPGRGQILDNLQSLFYTAPVMFHYLRYFTEIF